MTALGRLVTATPRRPTLGTVSASLWLGRVIRQMDDGNAWVTIPRMLRDEPIRVRSTVQGLQPDAGVLIGAVENTLDELVIITTLTPALAAPLPHVHLASDISDSTVTGRAVLTGDAAAGRTALAAKAADWLPAWTEVTGKPATFPPDAHTHGGADITGTGKSSTTFLRGDNTWVTPTNTTYSAATQAEIENAASTTARLITGQRMAQGVAFHAPVKTVAGKSGAVTLAAADLTDSTVTGRSVLTAADAATARAAIGAGTGSSNLVIGTTAGTAKAGDYVPSWTEVTSKPTTFPPSAHTHPATDISDSGTTGRKVLQSNEATPTADRILFWDQSAGAYAHLSAGQSLSVFGTILDVDIASTTVTGVLRIATDAEVSAGTNTTKAVTPAGVALAINDRTSAWTAFTLLNAWVAYTGGGGYYMGAQWRIVGRSIEINGLVKSGATGTAIFNFPSGFVPAWSRLYPTVVSSTGGRSVGYLNANTGTSNLIYDAGTTAPTYCQVDAIFPLS